MILKAKVTRRVLVLRLELIKKGLSRREVEVAEQVVLGQSNKEVGIKLFVTEKTIKFHLTNIYKKLSINSRTQLIVLSLPHMSELERKRLWVDATTNTKVPPETQISEPAPTNDGMIPLGNSPISKVI